MFSTLFASAFLADAAALAPSMQSKLVAVESAVSEDVTNRLLWDGIDILDTDDEQENSFRFGRMEMSHLAWWPEKLGTKAQRHVVNVEVMGLQDTGTNLLTSLLYRNFGGQMLLFDSAFHGWKQGVWKHANTAWIDEKSPWLFDNMKNHSVVPLVVVRNPLSWLQSVKKAPYELDECVAGSDWLSKPCVHKIPAGYVQPPVGQGHFEHLSGIWGRWSESYETALRKHFSDVVMLSYEDIVLRTADTVQYIADALNLTMPKVVDVVESPAKKHGKAVGHDVAASKIENREYLDEYTHRELSLVCEQLLFFRDTLLEHGYDDCFAYVNEKMDDFIRGEVELPKSGMSGMKNSTGNETDMGFLTVIAGGDELKWVEPDGWS